MSKRKSKSKAKRSPARKPAAKRRRIPRDAAGHQLLFDPRTGKPTIPTRPLTAEQRARIEARRREGVRLARERREAESQRQAAMMARRPAVLRRGFYQLPTETEWFLRRLFSADGYRFWYYQHGSLDNIARDRGLEHALLCAYMQGCAEGYIEGQIDRRIEEQRPRRERSAKANAAKQHVPVQVGDATMTRRERDARMAAEFVELVKLMKPTPAMQRLADKYGFESWQGVRAVLKRIEAGDRQ
jgi:hypothetical protein